MNAQKKKNHERGKSKLPNFEIRTHTSNNLFFVVIQKEIMRLFALNGEQREK